MSHLRVEELSALPAQQVDEVLDLIATVERADRVAPVSEHVVMQVRYARAPHVRHLLLRDDRDRLVGYAQLDGEVLEVAAGAAERVHALVEAAGALVGGQLQVWAHGEGSTAAAVLPAMGLRPFRVLLQLRRSLEAPLPAPVWPPEVAVRTFVVGQDEAAWLALNNASFADHPDQSNWTMADVTQREQEPWFDPAGLILAERGAELVGSHWTKVHAHDPHGGSHDDAPPIGEVYVVAVAPSMQGRHLGSAITLAGLAHLRERGLATVMLYVDESNPSAVHVYERLGFHRFDVDVCFQR